MIWRNEIKGCPIEVTRSAFDSAGETASDLKMLYGIQADRAVSRRLGALDLLHDARFNWPIEKVADEWKLYSKEEPYLSEKK